MPLATLPAREFVRLRHCICAPLLHRARDVQTKLLPPVPVGTRLFLNISRTMEKGAHMQWRNRTNSRGGQRSKRASVFFHSVRRTCLSPGDSSDRHEPVSTGTRNSHQVHTRRSSYQGRCDSCRQYDPSCRGNKIPLGACGRATSEWLAANDSEQEAQVGSKTYGRRINNR